MAALTKPMQEAFAQAMADGANYMAAAMAAGYAGPRNYRNFADKPKIAKRIAEIRHVRAWGGSRELGVLIDELAATAIQARALNTAQGATAARGLFDLVGKYKDKLPGPASPPPAPAVPAHPDDEDLSEAEWLARYGPDAPGGKLASP